jgi:hypothetical protein
MTWVSPGGKSFTDITQTEQFRDMFKFTAAELATFNAADARILAAKIKITYNGSDYITQSGDSLNSIAEFFNINLSTLLESTGVLTDEALIRKIDENYIKRNQWCTDAINAAGESAISGPYTNTNGRKVFSICRLLSKSDT